MELKNVARSGALIGLLAAGSLAARDPVNRHSFIAAVMVVTDQPTFVQVFAGSPVHGKPVLWVQIPKGVEGIGADETIEREGRNGLVIMAHEHHICAQQLSHKLVFSRMAPEGGGVSTFFRTCNHKDASAAPPILKGSAWVPVFDGQGPARVEFRDRIPADRKCCKRDRGSAKRP